MNKKPLRGPCTRAATLRIGLVVVLAVAALSGVTWAHHDPNTNFCAGPSIAIDVFRSDNGSPGVPIAGESTILECENIFYRVRLSPFPGCVAIERGTLTLTLPDGTPVNLTPTEGIPCIGGLTDDENSAANDGRGLCLGSEPVFFSAFVPFDIGVLGPPFAGEAIVSAQWAAGFAHFDNDDEPNQGAETEISTPITVCPENTNECAEGPFCDPATAAQGVDVACGYPPLDESTDCTDTDGNQCTFAGCDGNGICVQDHNVTECPDDGNPCTDDGVCEPATGECEYPPLDQSTDCPDTDGNQCTFAGCDGAGVCVQDHNETECPDDGNPCTDDPFCETTSGECVYPPLDQSTDCPDTDGNQCTFAGCDGAGVCVQDHNETECPPDGNPCTDDGACEPATGECEYPPLDESTDCPDTDGNQCTFAGCDGAGVCVQDHNETECPDIDICLDEYCDTDTGDCVADCIAGDYPDECSVTVGDYIWHDTNADGLQDGEESGISGVVVELLDCAGNPAEDYAGNPVPGDTTDADGLYEFSVLTCDDPESFKVMVADSNFGGGVLTGYNSSPQYQDGGPPSAIDSDCGADHMTGCTDIARGTTDDTLDCGFYPPGEAICRTPGFWGSHGDITAQLLKAAGDLPAPYDEPDHYGVMICGQPVTWNETPETLGDLENALEGLCVRVQGVNQRQLYRQLVAFHLNCIISSSLGDCDALLSTASACDALCASGQNDDGTVSINDCISMIDCFNNGGTYEAASGGTRADSPDTERDSRGILDLTLGGPEDDTASTTEDGMCVFLGDSCHDRDLCPSGGVGDGFCFEPPGPASTPKTCKNARKNDCTIDDCNGD